MNEQELRSLVRAAVARHLGAGTPRSMPPGPPAGSAVPLYSSHSVYAGLVNVGDACLIEADVPCDHCGYCKSHGH